MSKVVKLNPWLIAGVAALTLVGALGGVAAATGPYTVKVKVVPKNVALDGTFTVTAHGTSANTSLLKVFLNSVHKCGLTAAADRSFVGDVRVLLKQVTGPYSWSKTETGLSEGQHHACAYLTSLGSPPLLRARAHFTYTVG